MASTQSGGHSSDHGRRRSRRNATHDASRDSGRDVNRRRRRSDMTREQKEDDETENYPDEPDEEIILPGRPITPILINQKTQYRDGHGLHEGGPGNGWTYAGQSEPFPGDGKLDNVWPYSGPNRAVSGAEQPTNDGLAQVGQLIGLDNLPHYSPVVNWAGSVSEEYNPINNFLFGFDPQT